MDCRLIQIRLMFLDGRKLLGDVLAEWTPDTARSPQSVLGVAARVRYTEHFFIVTLIAVRIPKHRTEGVAPLRLALRETGLESCGTDTALGLPDACYIQIRIVFLDDTLCWFLFRPSATLLGEMMSPQPLFT